MTAPTDPPYDLLVVRPDEIDALLAERLGAARQYDNPHERQAFRNGVMETLACLEQYHGVALPEDDWRHGRDR